MPDPYKNDRIHQAPAPPYSAAGLPPAIAARAKCCPPCGSLAAASQVIGVKLLIPLLRRLGYCAKHDVHKKWPQHGPDNQCYTNLGNFLKPREFQWARYAKSNICSVSQMQSDQPSEYIHYTYGPVDIEADVDIKFTSTNTS